MPSAVEQMYGVPLAHEALLRWLGERYGAEAEQEAREVYRAANKRYGRAAKVRAESLWLKRTEGRHVTEAMARRAARARALVSDPMAYIDGGN